MLKYLRANNKKILAILGVFLMIAFIVPSNSRQGGGRSYGTVGYLGKEAIGGTDYGNAQTEWDILTKKLVLKQDEKDKGKDIPRYPVNLVFAQLRQELSRRITTPLQARQQREQIEALASRAKPDELQDLENRQAMERDKASGEVELLGSRIYKQLDGMSYFLLLKEAQRMGIRPDPGIIEQYDKALESGDASRVTPAMVHQSISDWTLVLRSLDRVLDAAKISPAAVLHRLAAEREKACLKLVEFKVDDYKAGITPTNDQLKAFYEKYRDVDAQTDEMGIGYRQPTKLAIDYFMVRREQIHKAIMTKDANRLPAEEVIDEYEENPNKFQRLLTPEKPATQPATQPIQPVVAGASTTQPATNPTVALAPATAPATSPTASPVASATPTTRPWNKLTDFEKNRIVNAVVEERTLAVARSLKALCDEDYKRLVREGTGIPTTVPASQPAGSYYAESYLDKIVRKVKELPNAYNIEPLAVPIRKPLALEEMRRLQWIGTGDPTAVLPTARWQYRQRSEIVIAPPEQGFTPEQLAANLGLQLDELPISYYMLSGVAVTGAPAGMPASAAGLRGGEIILRINGQSVSSVEQAEQALKKANPKSPVQVLVTNRSRRMDLAGFAFEYYKPLMSSEQFATATEESIAPLSPWEFSPIFIDREGNLYTLRVVDVQRPRPAESYESVAARVREDYIRYQAFLKAQQAAEQLAKDVESKGIVAAAGNRKVIDTGLFVNTPKQKIADYPLAEKDTASLVKSAFDLVQARLVKQAPHPESVIGLPRNGKVVVGELQQLVPATIPETNVAMAEFSRHDEIEVIRQWFNTDSIKARLNFRPEESKKQPKDRHEPVPQQQAPPEDYGGF